MSTWTEVVYYIKTQLKPGVLGHTDVQKILNAILAIIHQVNAGDYSPTNAALWKAEVSYSADVVPVIWQDNWLVSNTAGNLGNVPISTSGVLHPSWRIIGSSPGSGIRIWEPIVYPNTLEMVFSDRALYYLNREVVGGFPFVSVDFTSEVADDIWLDLMKDHNHDDRYFSETEINNFFSGSTAVTGYNKSNWDAAFSWGNHAGLYALASHVHTIAQVTSLQTALDGKASSSHTHTIAQVTGLQSALDGKEAAFTKNTAFNKNFGTALGTVAEGNDSRINNGQTAFSWGNHAGLYALASHVHTIAQVTGLQTALDGKASSSHTHTIAQVTSLQTALDGKEAAFSKNTAFNKNFGAALGTVAEGNDSRINNGQTAFGWGNHAGLYSLLAHTHTIAQVTGLQGALDGKEAAFTKNTAFNKSFGTAAGTVAQGNDSRINNGQTAFGWGNHAGLYSLLAHTHTEYVPFTSVAESGVSKVLQSSSLGYLMLDNWIRTGSGTGFYNSSGHRLYNTTSPYNGWALRSSVASQAALMLRNVNEVDLGSVYADDLGNIGFTNSAGSNWRLRVTDSGAYFPANTGRSVGWGNSSSDSYMTFGSLGAIDFNLAGASSTYNFRRLGVILASITGAGISSEKGISTAVPYGGSVGTWRLGTAEVAVNPFANRLIRVQIGDQYYDILAANGGTVPV